MILDGRSLNDISLDDIRLLVENQVPEGPHLDYKVTPYSGASHDRREMLHDVIALANAEGGYLILGIEEDLAGRPVHMVPFENAHKISQAIRQTCLDGISDRVEGLEVRAYETGFNQGIIAIRVPPSEWRPHMVTLDHRTDFYRRYDTDKRCMTIGEIRELVLSNPRFRQLVELQLKTSGKLTVLEGEHGGPPYVQLLTDHPVQVFLQRYMLGSVKAQTLVVVSPFIGSLAGEAWELGDITQRACADGTRLYVITREPQAAYHEAGLAVLKDCPLAEIRYNADIHAKLYIVWSRDEDESFAFFGSGNLTESGLRHNIELGMLIYSRGHGRAIVRELYDWSSAVLRARSKRIKEIAGNPPRVS